jgi:hypothetical protein
MLITPMLSNKKLTATKTITNAKLATVRNGLFCCNIYKKLLNFIAKEV